MTCGIFKFEICLQFNGTATVKAPSKKQALEALKGLTATLGKVENGEKERIVDYDVELRATAEERI